MLLCFVLAILPFLPGLLCEESDLAVYVKEGGDAVEQVATRLGMKNMGEIIPGTNYYWLKDNNKIRTKRSVRKINQTFDTEEGVDWMEFQSPKLRVKRSPLLDDQYDKDGSVVNDPMWKSMWYLNRKDGLTMKVEEAWKLGVTGQGVTVTILDDGIETNHPDLMQNYDPHSSTDINDNDSDPTPQYDLTNTNRQGTRCAGVVAAAANNSLCTVGIAFNAKIGGIRMLDGPVNDMVEAKSLSFNRDHIDIYSISWGPYDDGKTVEGPAKLAKLAISEGILKGRSGRGSIFVWASGIGGGYKDNCNCDGYASSIYTITVSSATEEGRVPWYSEACSATLATTYSSGSRFDGKIITTDLNKGCTSSFTGTSASSPMASAIIALALEANPALTWRDMQHIMVRTARPGNLQASDWTVNGVNRKVSHSYGYGMMDAEAMVTLSRKWISMPDQQSCEVASPGASPYEYIIPAQGNVTIRLVVNPCKGVRYLEHVVSTLSLIAGRKRGDLRIYLHSPSGTRSTLLDNRPQDYSSKGFTFWPFMSTHSWGENPAGAWTLVIHNDATFHREFNAHFLKWTLKLYGTEDDPNIEEMKERTENIPDLSHNQ